MWILALLAGCAHGRDCAADPPKEGEVARCAVAGREYLVLVPSRRPEPAPLVVALHGGGGSAEQLIASTCADPAGPGCLTAAAARDGYVLVVPDGTAARIGGLRTWNAGGGHGPWQCTSGRACAEGVDDVAFVRAVLDDVSRWTRIDPGRVYAAGHSNGGAMAYRLACEASDRFAGIMAVGAGDQYGADQGCHPSRPVAILDVHGTADPCWAYAGGPQGCLQEDGTMKVGVSPTLTAWAARDGCAPAPEESALPDRADDGVTGTWQRYPGCAAPVWHLRLDGGGHGWPGAESRLGSRIGPTTRDATGAELMWGFFSGLPAR